MARNAARPPIPGPSGLSSSIYRGLGSVSFLAMLTAAGIVLTGYLTAFDPVQAAEPESPRHSIEEISATAETYFRERFGTTDSRLTPRAGYLDPRLRLAECSEALEPFLPDGASPARRTMVGVRCSGSQPWKIYVPIDVTISDTVVVARRSLASGHTVTPEDIDVVEREVSRLSQGYMAHAEDVLGKRLKQNLLTGRVITPSMLLDEIMIKRGQTVTIAASGNGIDIAMAGTALSDGTLNQRIRVENTASKRVIEAIVRSSELVEVIVY